MTPRTLAVLTATALASCGSKTSSPYDLKQIDRYCFQRALTLSYAPKNYEEYGKKPVCDPDAWLSVKACERMLEAEPAWRVEMDRARKKDFQLGWSNRKHVARWLEHGLQFCADVVPGDVAEHRRGVAAITKRFVAAATPTEAAAPVAELAALGAALQQRVRATLHSSPRSFRGGVVAAHCQKVWAMIHDAVEPYEQYVKETRCRDVGLGEGCVDKLDDVVRADEIARQRALPLGWEDRMDVEDLVREDLIFCLYVVDNGERAAAEEAIVDWIRSSRFARSSGSIEQVAVGVRKLRDLADRMRLRFEPLTKSTE
jgi:hypothetical protein